MLLLDEGGSLGLGLGWGFREADEVVVGEEEVVGRVGVGGRRSKFERRGGRSRVLDSRGLDVGVREVGREGGCVVIVGEAGTGSMFAVALDLVEDFSWCN